MSLHKEIHFEAEIAQHLGAHGWLYEEKTADNYDRKLALYPPDLIAWLQESQIELWETYQQKNGSKAEANLLHRIRDQLDQQGTLDLLRKGIEVMGLPKALKLAEFKPALGLNPEILARYSANRLRVVRQVRYSLHNQNSIDLVLSSTGSRSPPSNSRPITPSPLRTPSGSTRVTAYQNSQEKPLNPC